MDSAGVVNRDSHGVVAGDVDVPDYGKDRLSASSVLLTSTDSARTPVRREDFGPFEGRLTAAPTSRRAFGPREEIETYPYLSVKVNSNVISTGTGLPFFVPGLNNHRVAARPASRSRRGWSALVISISPIVPSASTTQRRNTDP